MLDVTLRNSLTNQARQAAQRAYAPYSKFSVGAAALFEDGVVILGCNVENASYGLTICAERNAIAAAIALGHRKLKAIVIYTPTSKATAPCGACRQVLNEFGPDCEFISVCDSQDTLESTGNQLLPFAFGPKNLTEG
jgi:cytidine deaminase